MFLESWLIACAVLLAAAIVTWVASVARRDVTIVDTLWPLLFVMAGATFAVTVDAPGPRTPWVLGLVTAWGLRLALHLAIRSHGKPEDRRYQAIRARNEPNFAFKSLYLVFGFQALLASVIALPLLGAIGADAPLGALDYAGIALWCVGFLFESVGDWQLVRFKTDPRNAQRVLDTGLWAYTRHPNYFGDFCVWWGLFLLALGAGAWWTIVGPLLMSALLLRVSGVTLLEKDIVERRPGYRAYVQRTNAFFPGPPRR